MVKTMKTFYLSTESIEKLTEIAGTDKISATVEALIDSAHARLAEIKRKAENEADSIIAEHK